MANTANSTLTTDFNVTPYYDDYDQYKNFHRILFKPGYAVQGRELTQMQTILQQQINRFGKHMFREGSIVLPGAFTLEMNSGKSLGRGIPYVKIDDLDTSNNTVSVNTFVGAQLRGNTSNITAQVIEVLDGAQGTAKPKTFYIRYTSTSSANSNTKTFLSGETLVANISGTIYTANVANSAAVANVTGTGSRFSISEGVFFAKEHFIAFPTQSIIVDRYSPNPTAKVGFYVTEELIDASQDASLLDPAQEASNFAAPGADRLKLNPQLTVFDYAANTATPDFVELFSIKEGVVQTYLERTQYNILNDELAKRTYDESGDYVVQGMDVQLREHDDTGTNFGRYANGNNKLLFAGVAPGSAYVKGYEISTFDITGLEVEKGLSVANVNGQVITTSMGSYVVVDEMSGVWELDKGNQIGLYNIPENRISTGKWSVSAQNASSQLIGTARLNSIEYKSGTPGYDAQYYVYLSDIRMAGSNTFSQVRSLYRDNGAPQADLYADIVLNTSGNAVLQGLGDAPLLYTTGSDFTKTIRTVGNPTATDMVFSFNRTEAVEILPGGTFNVVIPVNDGSEIFPYGASALSASDKRELSLVFNQVSTGASFINLSFATASSGTGTTALVGQAGTHFEYLNVGDKIAFSGNNTIYYITAITDATHATVNANLPTFAGNTIYKVYKSGDSIDLTGKGATGVTRSITGSANNTLLSFNLQENFAPAIGSNSIYATVTTKVTKRNTSFEIPKKLRRNRKVKINCANNAMTTTGPFTIGFSDVYKINKILLRNDGTYPTSNTDTSATDVTSSFIIDNGQRDTHYDYANLTPKIALTSSSRLLVDFDYFQPDFTSYAGYFSIDSYPIQDNDTFFSSNTNIRTENVPIYKSPVSGKDYDLRNMLDFRPVKKKATGTADTWETASASVNPAYSTDFDQQAAGMKFPVPSTEVNFDYSLYLGRKDLVVVDKDKRFQIVKGIPSTSPITPDMPADKMALASIDIVPYPSLSPAYGEKLGRRDLACSVKKLSNLRFTMRDIGVLKQRIVNLEYYTALSVLEKAAADLVIKDDNGNDRFKNGIFTDPFRDHSLGATYTTDYRATVDPEEKVMRPLYTMHSFDYDYIAGSSSGTVKNDALVTLNYTNVLHYEQAYATVDINVERQSWLFLGSVSLFPDQDVWIDTKTLPDEVISFQFNLTNTTTPQSKVTTEWGAWKKYVTGYRVFTGTGANRQAVNYGNTYRTYDEAKAIANSNNPPGNGRGVTIEAIYNNVRTGTEHWFSDTTTTQTSGYKVVDVQVIPYIRPQTITVKCSALKPYTQVWCYFDKEPMTQYCRQITSAAYTAITDGIDSTLPVLTNYAEGAGLFVDGNGDLFFQLRLPPEKKFRVGSRSVVVVDSRIGIDEDALSSTGATDDYSTGGRAFFFASGTAVTQQKTIYSTRVIASLDKEVQENYASSSYEEIPGPPAPPQCSHSCSAYSFLARAPNGEEGMFLTGVDMFVSRKDAKYGMWVEIREMANGGGPTRNQVPFSEVRFDDPASIPISTDGKTNPLQVRFKAPVFLYHNTQYALVIHPINANPNLYVWISRLGQTDINGLGPVIDRRGFGTFYQTNNNTNWDIIDGADLTCKFYRAEFQRGSSGVAVLGNKPVERMFVTDRSIPMDAIEGQILISGDRLTLADANGTIAVGNTVVGITSGASANVVWKNGTVHALANTGFKLGERVIVNKGTSVVSANVSLLTNARGYLNNFIDGSDYQLVEMTSSDGAFVVGDIVRGYTNPSYFATVSSLKNFRYSAASFEPSVMNFKTTATTYEMRPYSNTSVQGSYVSIEPSETYYWNTEQALHSRSNEVNNLAGERTNQVLVNMSTGSNTVTPVLDMARTHTVYLDNLIDSNTTSESAATGGGMLNRYISRTITLAEGQDAEDLQVILTAYRPPQTDVKVWLRILHAEDSDVFAQRGWIEMTKDGDGDITYSALNNRFDFKEFKFNIPSSYMTGAGGAVQYTNSSGATFTGYKYFAVKVGIIVTPDQMGSINTAVVPRVGDLRCIALQM